MHSAIATTIELQQQRPIIMDQNGKDDLKTQFVTREGTYRLITLSEYSRPNRVGYQSNQNNPQVRVSLLPAKPNTDAAKALTVGSTTSATISTNTAPTNSVNTIFNYSYYCSIHQEVLLQMIQYNALMPIQCKPSEISMSSEVQGYNIICFIHF